MGNAIALILDDCVADRSLLRNMLDETGFQFEIFEAADGRTALSLLKGLKQTFLIDTVTVFMDREMPVVNGEQFLVELSAVLHDLGFKVDVIVVASSCSMWEARKLKSFNLVKEYFVKGEFSSEDLKKKIVELFPFGFPT